tara:strand:+ start:1009 stop:1380 length:372 start_codon:yes stop_codon:yes gene_type:complete
MVWKTTDVDLTREDVKSNRVFIERFCKFGIDHLAKHALLSTPGTLKVIPMTTFARSFDNTGANLMFEGGSSGIITLTAAYYGAAVSQLSLLDMIGMDHERGVLDLYRSIYGKPIDGYTPTYER